MRICNACSSNNIGDEYHLLLECANPTLKKFRTDFISKIAYLCPAIAKLDPYSKFQYLLSLTDSDLITPTCNFISQSLDFYHQNSF